MFWEGEGWWMEECLFVHGFWHLWPLALARVRIADPFTTGCVNRFAQS